VADDKGILLIEDHQNDIALTVLAFQQNTVS
jgi:hypothetical protein